MESRDAIASAGSKFVLANVGDMRFREFEEMARRTPRRLAAPFVATFAIACTKREPIVAEISHNPPAPSVSETPASEDASADAGDITYDGYASCYRMVDGEKKYVPRCPESLLPIAPDGKLVYSFAGYCHRVPDGALVQCPKTGPTAILPEPSSIDTTAGSIHLRYGELTCFRSQNVKCPPKVACNPPPPQPVPCPPELLPKLAPGVQPTKRDGARCWFDEVEVACPKS